MEIGSFLSGALLGVIVEQVAMHLINKGHIERAVEQAERVIPDRYEPILAKMLDEASKELKDQDGGDEN